MDDQTPLRTGKTLKDTSGRGDVTEFAVLYALARLGKKVLRPASSAMRYDLLVDNEDGTFVRIQCKTAVLRDGRIEFRLYSISGHNTRAKHYGDQVDAYGVHCHQTGTTYLVPVGRSRAAGRSRRYVLNRLATGR